MHFNTVAFADNIIMSSVLVAHVPHMYHAPVLVLLTFTHTCFKVIHILSHIFLLC